MAADDDLMLNWSVDPVPAAATAARSSKKGGRWTDRARDKRRERQGPTGQGQGQRVERKESHSQEKKVQEVNGGAGVPSEKSAGETRTTSTTDSPTTSTGGGAGAGIIIKPRRSRPTDSPSASTSHAHTHSNGAGGGGGGGGKKHYVSSLFTAEGLPTASTSTSQDTPESFVYKKPSNAPLPSSLAPPPTQSAATLSEPTAIPTLSPSLSSLSLHPSLVNHLVNKLSIHSPTQIQKTSIPLLLNSPSKESFILQSQTGSGKTLAFLLPLVQDLLLFNTRSLNPKGMEPDRSIGTLAIILSPTRELAQQTFSVLSSLLSLPYSTSSTPSFPFPPTSLTPCLLIGGANRTHEKRRLRKGAPIIVATPGRLLDHLKTTESFRLAGERERTKGPKGREGNSNLVQLGRKRGGEEEGDGEGERLGLRWLVVDECDRLMDLGFEEQMKGILEDLDKRRRMGAGTGGKRRTILCSATAGEGVERLLELVLGEEKESVKTIKVAGEAGAKEEEEEGTTKETTTAKNAFTAPTQLQHSYIITPPKLRFVTLLALLRSHLSPTSTSSTKKGKAKKAKKIVVFMSCTDAVDFYWLALGRLQMGSDTSSSSSSSSSGEKEMGPNVVEGAKARVEREKREAELEEKEKKRICSKTKLLKGVGVYRLHGNLELDMRTRSLKGFSEEGEGEEEGKVLLCTSVAARGLDVDDVGLVVQYDLPTEGGITEYLHRSGRTARAGASGQSISFLLPTESEYVPFLENGLNKEVKMREVGVEGVLREGYGGEGREFENRATDVQMGLERWVVEDSVNSTKARNAFASHIRAYATHPHAEKSIFNTKSLHLGHLAKSFGMREAPGSTSSSSSPSRSKSKKAGRVNEDDIGRVMKKRRVEGEEFEVGRQYDEERAGKRNREKIMRGPTGGDKGEFQVASGELLEMLARGTKRKRG